MTNCKLRLAPGTVQFGMKYGINNVRGQKHEKSLLLCSSKHMHGAYVSRTLQSCMVMLNNFFERLLLRALYRRTLPSSQNGTPTFLMILLQT